MLFVLQHREHTSMSGYLELQHQSYVSLYVKNKKVSLIANQALAAWEEVPDKLKLPVKGFESLHWIHL